MGIEIGGSVNCRLAEGLNLMKQVQVRFGFAHAIKVECS
jgi:hypothetical protein